MNKDTWSNIDVKDRIIEDIAQRALQLGFDIHVHLKNIMECRSIRELSEPVSPLDHLSLPADIVKELKDLAQSKYIYYRNMKYGNQEFWSCAQRERMVGYDNWFDFINTIINQYTDNDNDAILFLGTADGWEIPQRKNKLYAIEQIQSSCDELSKKRKDIEIILGDFEDDNLLIEKKMKLVIALRCLMPNTRLGNFFKFIDNVIMENGYLLLSHPMKYLYGNALINIADSEDKLCAFRKRLSSIVEKSNYHIYKDFRTNIEHFFILQKTGEHDE